MKIVILWTLRNRMNRYLDQFTNEKLHDINPRQRDFGGETIVTNANRTIQIDGFEEPIVLLQVLELKIIKQLVESEECIGGLVDRKNLKVVLHLNPFFLQNDDVRGNPHDLFLVKRQFPRALRLFVLALMGSRQMFRGY